MRRGKTEAPIITQFIVKSNNPTGSGKSPHKKEKEDENMKKIIFTITARQYGITIKTTSALADTEDKAIESVRVALLHEMNRLTSKYNAKDIAVLFEVE